MKPNEEPSAEILASSKIMDDVSPLAAFTRVGHALFARNGVKLSFGRRWDGKIIHISQASRGAACGCECPAQSCRRKLIARKPETNVAHHFAHAPLTPSERAAGVAPNCEHGPMTALHEHAEELLNKTKSLVLPPVGARFGSRSRTIRSAKNFTFDSAKLETLDGETIPDVILFKGDHKMHVEVFVTNRCSQEKRAKIIAANISAVEIDLSGLSRDVTFEGLDEAILKSAPREWIHNRKAQELLSTLEGEANAEAARTEQRRREAIADLTKAYANAHRQALASKWKNAVEVVEVTNAGYGDLLKSPAGGEGYFSVHPKVWKATILGPMLAAFGGTTPGSIISEFSKRGWIVGRFGRLAFTDDSMVGDAKLPPGGPEQIVINFLLHLARKGVAEDSGWKWAYTARHSEEISKRRRERDLIAREAAERAVRHKRLASLANEIIASGAGGEASDFALDGWLDHRIDSEGQTVRHITDEGASAWRNLFKGLSNTLAVLKGNSEEAVQEFGLPIGKALDAARIAQEARAAQRKLEAEEAARLERVERVDRLIQAARAALGAAHPVWIDSPNPALNDLTPREAAGESPEQLARVRQLLQKYFAELEQKEKWLGELEREASTLLRRPDKVAVYMNSSDPKLPGHASPRAHTKDKETMLECLSLLKQRLGKR